MWADHRLSCPPVRSFVAVPKPAEVAWLAKRDEVLGQPSNRPRSCQSPYWKTLIDSSARGRQTFPLGLAVWEMGM